MQRIVVALSAALFASLAIGAWAGGPSPQTSTTKKKSTVKSATKASAKTTGAKRTTVATKSKRPPVTAHHYAPQQPSTERYKEIQQALASRGYFKTEPDGTWGPASVDALKHFQRDQNLIEDGKIGSLSLIALGLGPKREPVEATKTVESEQKIP